MCYGGTICYLIYLTYRIDSNRVSNTKKTSFFLAEIPVVDPIVCLISMQSGCVGSFVVFDSLWSYLGVFVFAWCVCLSCFCCLVRCASFLFHLACILICK